MDCKNFTQKGICVSELSDRLNLGALTFFVFFLMFNGLSKTQAQSHDAIKPDSIVKITIDETGKLKNTPEGFALVNGNAYSFEVTVEKPTQQQQAFLSFLQKKFKNTYDKLGDDDLPYAKAYLSLLGSKGALDSLRSQLKELSEILEDKNPEQKLQLSKNSFSYLLGKNFLTTNLFGKTFTLTNNLNDTTESFDINKDAVIKIAKKYVYSNELNLTIRMSDLQKQFITSYYNNAFLQIKSIVNKIKPQFFYHNIIPEITNLSSQLTTLRDIIQPQIKEGRRFICDSSLFERYISLKKIHDNNALIQIIVKPWLVNWAWFNEGALKINPINFTESDFLLLKDGFDTVKAKRYDQYIKSVTDLMIKSDQLNDKKTSHKLFDTLSRQEGKGKELYSYKSENENVTKTNQNNKDAFQSFNNTLITLKFRVIDQDSINNYFLKSYDASAHLKSGKYNKAFSLSNDISVETMAYNLNSNEDFSVNNSPIVIKDQSKAIAQLDQASDLATALATQAIQASSIFTSILKKTNPPKGIPNFVLNASTPFTTDSSLSLTAFSFHGARLNSAIEKFTVQKAYSHGQLILKGMKNTARQVEQINVTKQIIDFLKTNDIDNCESLTTAINKDVQKINPEMTKTFNIINVDEIDKNLSQLTQSIDSIIKINIKKFEGRQISDINNNMLTMSNNLKIAELLIKSNSYSLPPKELKETLDTNAASYHNKYISVAGEQSAKQINLELSVINKKTKEKTIKVKDSYKTAPTHWVTASLGVNYIFDAFRRSDATVVNNVVTNTADEEQTRLIAGLNFYPFPIILADDRCIFQLSTLKEIKTRFSIFTGVSFPQPFYNLHAGISIDLWTGIRVTGGYHFYRYTSYTILNNQILDQHSFYVNNNGFIGLTIEPITFVKLIGLVK